MLGAEVAEHGKVDAAGHREPVCADDRDVHQAPYAGLGRGTDEVTGLVLVALAAACAMNDDLDSYDGGLDPLPRREVTGPELDAVVGARATSAAEHSDVAPAVL